MLTRKLMCLALALPACGDTTTPGGGGTADPGTGTNADDTATSDADSTEGSGDSTGPGQPGDPGDPVALRCPDNPELTDPLILLGNASADTTQLVALEATETHAFACSPDGGLVSWDITDPTAPTLLGAPDGDPCTALSLSGERLAVGRADRIELLDIGNPAAATVVASTTVDVGIEDIALDLDGGTMHVAAGTDGVLAFTVGDASLTESGRHSDGDSDARALALVGGQLVVAEAHNGARLYDVTGATPTVLDTLAVEGVLLGLAADEDMVWATTIEGLTGIDVAADSLTLRGSAVTHGQALGVAVGEHFVVVADWNTVVGIDGTDPAAPAVVTSEPLPQTSDQPRTRAVTVTPEGRVLVAGWSELWVHGPACPVAAPAVFAEPPYLPFHATEDGATQQTRVVSIRNRGNRELVVEDIMAPAGMNLDEALPFSVGPGSAQPIEVNFDPGAGAGGDLVVVTNDPDQPQMTIEVAAGVLGTTLGEAPVPIRAVDLDGRVWDTAQMEGQVVLLAYFATW